MAILNICLIVWKFFGQVYLVDKLRFNKKWYSLCPTRDLVATLTILNKNILALTNDYCTFYCFLLLNFSNVCLCRQTGRRLLNWLLVGGIVWPPLPFLAEFAVRKRNARLRQGRALLDFKSLLALTIAFCVSTFSPSSVSKRNWTGVIFSTTSLTDLSLRVVKLGLTWDMVCVRSNNILLESLKHSKSFSLTWKIFQNLIIPFC